MFFQRLAYIYIGLFNLQLWFAPLGMSLGNFHNFVFLCLLNIIMIIILIIMIIILLSFLRLIWQHTQGLWAVYRRTIVQERRLHTGRHHQWKSSFMCRPGCHRALKTIITKRYQCLLSRLNKWMLGGGGRWDSAI